jgi:PAS domain S-box-containing protein
MKRSTEEDVERLTARNSDLERQLELLTASAARDRQVIDMVREGIAMVDAEGRWTYGNQRIEEMLGYEPGAMLGRYVQEVLDPQARTVADARAPERRRGVALSGEARFIRRDGQPIWAKFDSNQIMSAAGHHLGAVLLFVDLTERRNAEELLRRSEEQVRKAQQMASIGTWEWDLRTGAITRSAELCRIFGRTPEAYASGEGATFDHIHPDDRERVRAELLRAIATQTSYEMSYRVPRSDGLRFIRSEGVIVRDESGAAVRVVGTAQDLTERKQIEARLMIADRMASVGTLAAGAAHEINNPLAYVLSNLELAACEIRDIAGDAPSTRLRELGVLIAEAREGGERVRKIVRGLKTFSRADEERRLPLDVHPILDVAASIADNEIRHRARLVKDYGEVPPAFADEARLAQVFVNLLVNAAQAIPEGHAEANEIRLVTRTDASGRAVIEVRDSGCGMAPEVLARAFDPFFTTRPVGAGTGLGLSICHGIITALGGEITAESEPGRGSVFRVVLPAAAVEVAPAEAPTAAAATPARRARILVVDDDAMLGRALARMLKEHDVTVLTDARDARDRLARDPSFDLILCDLMMPEMTGMELHAELARTAPELASRMVFITGGSFTPAATDFLDRIPNERIDKPFAQGDIRARVQRILR